METESYWIEIEKRYSTILVFLIGVSVGMLAYANDAAKRHERTSCGAIYNTFLIHIYGRVVVDD